MMQADSQVLDPIFGRLSFAALPLHEPILVATFIAVAIGGIAFGGAPIGGLAIGAEAGGRYACGDSAFGAHVIDEDRRDPEAVVFFAERGLGAVCGQGDIRGKLL